MTALDARWPKLLVSDGGLLLLRDRVDFVAFEGAADAIERGRLEPANTFTVSVPHAKVPATLERTADGRGYQLRRGEAAHPWGHFGGPESRLFNVDVTLVRREADVPRVVRERGWTAAEAKAEGVSVEFEELSRLSEEELLLFFSDHETDERVLGYACIDVFWYPLLAAVATNPNTPASNLALLARMAPERVFDNPAWPLALLLAPDLLDTSPSWVKKLWRERLG